VWTVDIKCSIHSKNRASNDKLNRTDESNSNQLEPVCSQLNLTQRV
jgi:hypothetical protein